MQAYVAEFVGTAILILFGNGVVANAVLSKTKGNSGGWIVITAGWAVAVALAVLAAGRISGAHLNPAVTLALAVIGDFAWNQVAFYICAQMAGAAAGALLVYLAYLSHWKETSDTGAKLACYSTGPAVRQIGAAFTTEAIGSAALVFLVLAFGKVGGAFQGEQQQWNAVASAWFGPLLVGLLVFGIGLSLGGPTGYAINPARDLGPRVMHAILPIPGKGDSDWSYAWVPVVAPIVGAIAGAVLYRMSGL